MVIAGAFWLFLATSLVILVINDKRHGPTIAIACLVGTLATFGTNVFIGFIESQLYILMIDCTILLVLIRVIQFSDRYWPIWFAGFHIISVCSQISYIVFPARIPALYDQLSGFWAVPALGTAAIGAWMDRKRISQEGQFEYLGDSGK
jgi:hypothetical protein